jgi:hypothetical protein
MPLVRLLLVTNCIVNALAYIVNVLAYIGNVLAYIVNASAYIVNASACIVNVLAYIANVDRFIANASIYIGKTTYTKENISTTQSITAKSCSFNAKRQTPLYSYRATNLVKSSLPSLSLCNNDNSGLFTQRYDLPDTRQRRD